MAAGRAQDRRGQSQLPILRHQLLHHMPMHIGESKVAAGVAEGQLS